MIKEEYPRRSKEFLRSLERLRIKEVDMETAVGYLTAIARNHQSEDPVLISLFGKPKVDRRLFLRELDSRIKEKSGKSTSFFLLPKLDENKLQGFNDIKKRYPNFRFPLLFIETISDKIESTPDIDAARLLRRFPEIILYVYDSSMEKTNETNETEARQWLLRAMEDRELYAQNINVPFSPPTDVLLVNISQKKKI